MRFPDIRAARTVENSLYLGVLLLWVIHCLALYRGLRRTSPTPALFGTALSILGLVVLAAGALPPSPPPRCPTSTTLPGRPRRIRRPWCWSGTASTPCSTRCCSPDSPSSRWASSHSGRPCSAPRATASPWAQDDHRARRGHAGSGHRRPGRRLRHHGRRRRARPHRLPPRPGLENAPTGRDDPFDDAHRRMTGIAWAHETRGPRRRQRQAQPPATPAGPRRALRQTTKESHHESVTAPQDRVPTRDATGRT